MGGGDWVFSAQMGRADYSDKIAYCIPARMTCGTYGVITFKKREMKEKLPVYKGHPIPEGSGFNKQETPKFFRPPLIDISRCLRAEQHDGSTNVRMRLRRYTPRECFRLMGVEDGDIDKIQAAGISNSQQYKMAGNSIVVDVLYHIFRQLLIGNGNRGQQLSIF